jgi:signal transduction histidine kinase/ligand-binding sensor domain-containing protein
MRLPPSIRFAIAALALHLIAQPFLAAQDQRIFQMVHSSWTVRDGAPESINSLAQTPDGTLWLATRDGLYSFDGLKFSVSSLVPRKNIQSLFVARGGDLWLSGQNVPLTLVRGNLAKVQNRTVEGQASSIDFLQQDSAGSIWAILDSKKLGRLGADWVWHIVPGPKENCDQLGPIFIDSLDTQWIVADDALYLRARGEEKFKLTPVRVSRSFRFVEGTDRTVWVAAAAITVEVTTSSNSHSASVTLKHIDHVGNPLPDPVTHGVVSDVVSASDQSIWVSYTKGGVQRLPPDGAEAGNQSSVPGSQDLYGVADGLTTTGFRSFLRDRDGQIWIAGGRGLDKFKYATMVPVVANAINGWWSFCIAPNGETWVTIVDGFRAKIREDRLTRLEDRPNIASILCSADGGVHMLTGDGIAEEHNGLLRILPLLPNHGTHWEYWGHYQFTSVVILPGGRMIASTRGITENRLWMFQKGRWRLLPSSASVTGIESMLLDANGLIYCGSAQGQIIVLNSHTFERVSEYSARRIGAVKGFSKSRYGIFAYGENGVGVLHSGAFAMLPFANPDLATSVTGLAEDRNGDIWINGSRAIARIVSSEISEVIMQPSHQIIAREFREGDFHGSDIFRVSRNSAQVDSRGRVWLATANGIIYIDPNRLERPSHLPTLSIRSIESDGKPVVPDSKIVTGTRALDIQYFGINLASPESVIYRYRLQGYDPDWQDVGSRAEAIYTHLRPGKYTFQVSASNGDGKWTAPLSSASFIVLPRFYQTWWFEALCIAFLGFVLWLGFTARIRYIAAQIKLRAEERANERIRIARELHDTLLQGIHGLLLNFHAAAQRVPVDHESKPALERALVSADRVILEGRDRVNRLRSEHLRNGELELSLRELTDDLATRSRMQCDLETAGMRQALDPEVADEAYFIAREALANAFRHSGATQVVVTLDYDRDKLRLECSDNGRGFSIEKSHEHQMNGHWGLLGMSERAQRIGADFTLKSAPGEGVCVSIVVPAARAYIRNRRWTSLFRRPNGSEPFSEPEQKQVS